MGVVHAKERRAHGTEQHGDADGRSEIHLEGVPARVDRVTVNGLGRTRDDVVDATVRELFGARDFQDVILRVHSVRGRLDALGCFKNIGVYIDTSSGPGATPDGLEVTFHVRELKRVAGGVNTSVGNNEGSLLFGLKLPNLWGRGERVQTEFSYGTSKTNNFSVQLVKPVVGAADAVFTAGLYQQMSDWPWSGYRQVDRGLLLDLGFSSTRLARHNVQWDVAVRDLAVMTRAAAFAVREQCGPSLKSALRHVLLLDQRDDTVFPTAGCLLQLATELAGFGGDVGFLKNELFLQANARVASDIVVQGTVQAGFLRPTTVDKRLTLSDQFFLGGPLSLRGFQTRGAGPHADGSALGSDVYLAGGLHVFTPLPFHLGRGGFGDLFRTHLFVTAGNVGQLAQVKGEDAEQYLAELRRTARLSYGVGLAVRVGQRARIELNYCFPHSYERGDRLQRGVQFGVGLQFL